MATNLKLENFSDREILHIVNDHAVEDGYANVAEMAPSLGISRDGMSEREYRRHIHRCLGGRLGWIAKLTGTVERDPKRQNMRWRLTERGLAIVNNTVNRQLKESLVAVDDVNALAALDLIARRYQRTSYAGANLMRREWSYGTHKNRNI